MAIKKGGAPKIDAANEVPPPGQSIRARLGMSDAAMGDALAATHMLAPDPEGGGDGSEFDELCAPPRKD